MIVESPAKAKTIEKFLGSDYHVLSSQGHIRDIEGTSGNSIGIDFAHGYTPNYVVDPQKHHLIDTLSKEAKRRTPCGWQVMRTAREKPLPGT